MREKQEVRSTKLELYKNFNKLTLAGSIGVAVFVPVLAGPALVAAGIDVGQVYAINKVNRKNEKAQQSESGLKREGTIFSRTRNLFVAKGSPKVKAA